MPNKPINLLGRRGSASLALLCCWWAGALWADEPVKIPERAARKAATSKVEPDYPPMAKQMRVTGEVRVDAVVDNNGAVETVDVAKGNAMLGSACVNAVKKWKFTPFTAGDKPARAIVRLTFSFGM